jgi:anti-anti-sigma factor
LHHHGSLIAIDGPLAAAMRRVWAVYDAAHEEIGATLREDLLSHPEFGPLVRGTPPESEEDARRHELLRGAMLRGEWNAYWDDVRLQAAGYAHAAISFTSWVELIHLLRIDLLQRLVARAGVEASQLPGDLTALHRWLDDALAVFGQAFVSANEEVINRQQQAIRQLSTPVLQLRDGLLILPMVGTLDQRRLEQLRVELLEGIRQRRARVVVLDVTGVPEIDSSAANELISAVASARMMGAEVIISGLSAEIAQTLVTAGIDLRQVVSAGDLQSGIELAQRRLRLARQGGLRAPNAHPPPHAPCPRLR